MSKESSSSSDNQGERGSQKPGERTHVPPGRDRPTRSIASKRVEGYPESQEHQEQVSPLALSLARRVIKESPDAYPPIDEESHGRLIERYLQDPDNLPSTEKYLCDIYALGDPEGCIQQAREAFTGQDLPNLTGDQAKQLLLMPHLATAFLTPKPPFAKTIEHLSSVQSIAEENDTTTEEVFERDELYESFVRRVSSPQTVIQRVQETIALIDPAVLQENLRELEMSQLIILKGKSAYAMIDALLDQATEDVDSPKDIAEIDQQITHIRTSIITQGIETITRFWGEEGVDALSEEERKTLGIKDKEREKADDAQLLTDTIYNNMQQSVLKHFSPRLQDRIETEKSVEGIVDRYVQAVEDIHGVSHEIEWRITALPLAKKMASEKNVPFIEIYQNQEYLTELQRDFFTPQSYAEQVLKGIHTIDGKKMQEVAILRKLVNLAANEEVLGELIKELERGYRDAHTPQDLRGYEEGAKQLQMQKAEQLTERITELWGEYALGELSPQTQYELGNPTIVVYRDYRKPQE